MCGGAPQQGSAHNETDTSSKHWLHAFAQCSRQGVRGHRGKAALTHGATDLRANLIHAFLHPRARCYEKPTSICVCLLSVRGVGTHGVVCAHSCLGRTRMDFRTLVSPQLHDQGGGDGLRRVQRQPLVLQGSLGARHLPGGQGLLQALAALA